MMKTAAADIIFATHPTLNDAGEVNGLNAAVPPHEVGLFVMEIGDRSDLSKSKAKTAARAWREGLQRYPLASFAISMSGYDDDPREIWGIPEAVRFVRIWARYGDMDDFETARRVFGADPYSCLGTLAACGVFGEENRRKVQMK